MAVIGYSTLTMPVGTSLTSDFARVGQPDNWGQVSKNHTQPRGSLYVSHIMMPAAWDTAVITFECADGLDLTVTPSVSRNLVDANGEVAYTVVALNQLALPVSTFYGIERFKIRSGTKASPVSQTAARTFTLVHSSVV